MATLAEMLTFSLPTEKMRSKLGMPTSGVGGALSEALMDPASIASMAGGVGLAGILAKRKLRGLAKKVASGAAEEAGEIIFKPLNRMPRVEYTQDLLRGDGGQAARWMALKGPRSKNPGSMQVSASRNVPFFDWDLGPHEAKRRGTKVLTHPDMEDDVVTGLGETLDIARRYNSRLDQAGVPSNLSMYLSPGGYRAFQTAHRAPPGVIFGNSLFHPDKVDEMYKRFAREPRGFRTDDLGDVAMRPAFAFRTGPKPGRPGDYTAAHIGNMGSGKPIPRSTSMISRMHDRDIDKAITSNPDLMQVVLESLGKEFTDMSSADVDMVRKAISERYKIPITALPAAAVAAGLGSYGASQQ